MVSGPTAGSRKWVDGFLVVVTAHRTPRCLVEEALNVVRRQADRLRLQRRRSALSVTAPGIAFVDTDRAAWWASGDRLWPFRRGTPA
jgi:hypothetical protein